MPDDGANVVAPLNVGIARLEELRAEAFLADRRGEPLKAAWALPLIDRILADVKKARLRVECQAAVVMAAASAVANNFTAPGGGAVRDAGGGPPAVTYADAVTGGPAVCTDPNCTICNSFRSAGGVAANGPASPSMRR